MEEVGTYDVKLARDMNITGSLYVLIGWVKSLPSIPPTQTTQRACPRPEDFQHRFHVSIILFSWCGYTSQQCDTTHSRLFRIFYLHLVNSCMSFHNFIFSTTTQVECMSVVKLNRACCVLAHAAFFFAWSVLSFLR